MKHFLLLFFIVFSFERLIAQSSPVPFSPYQFNVPGSQVQCKMVPIQAGSFLMGSVDSEKGRETDEGPQKKVTLSAFWMGAYELSRDEFDVFYKDENTSDYSTVDAITKPTPQYIDLTWGMGKEGGYPVNSMSQYAALMYCRWLYNKTGDFYRLPTEAEWEYACRAGSTSRFYFGDDEKQLGKYAWFVDNSEEKYQKAGMKLPNSWGLYDMLGNVSEWTLDHYDEKRMGNMGPVSDNPFVEPNKAHYPKVIRGGGYLDEVNQLRSAKRSKSDPLMNRRDPQIPKSKWWLTDAPSVGFRIVRPLVQPSAEVINEFFKKYLGK